VDQNWYRSHSKMCSVFDCQAGHVNGNVKQTASERNIGLKFVGLDRVTTCSSLTSNSLEYRKHHFLIQAREMMLFHILKMPWQVHSKDEDEINERKTSQINSFLYLFHPQGAYKMFCRKFFTRP
jgi:hypothetical protein